MITDAKLDIIFIIIISTLTFSVPANSWSKQTKGGKHLTTIIFAHAYARHAFLIFTVTIQVNLSLLHTFEA